MYDAMDIAEYVLNYCEGKLKRPITNLQLQKFLYYIQGRNIAENHSPIFDNRMEAWKYGPVIPDVYYWYNDYMGDQITGVEFDNKAGITNEELEMINAVVDKKILVNPWDLVEQTHKEEPWIKNYIPGLNREISIFDLEDSRNIFI